MTALGGTLNLTRSVISVAGVDLTQTGTIIVAGTAGGVGGGGGRSDAKTLTGEFRSYANGSTRLITGTSTSRIQSLALRALTPDQVTELDDMMGLVICFRDTYGRKVFGSFLASTATDIPFSGHPGDNTLLTDVGFTIQSVTWDEEV